MHDARYRSGWLVVLFGVCFGSAAGAAPADDTPYATYTVAEDLEYPWSIAWLPNGDLLVTERAGRLHRLEPTEGNARYRRHRIDDVPDVFARNQAGLFEVLVDPEFEDNATIYLSMADGTARANRLRVVRARLEGDGLSNVETIFRGNRDRATPAHLGGRMTVLPDGTLLITQGDGFDYREAAQDPSNHLGTVVRIHRDGTVPSDNPFADGGVDAEGRSGAPEVWTWGHRNVQGIVHDPDDDTVWSHEHGPRGGDELNRLEAGENYGWPAATHGIDYSGARITPYRELPGKRSPVYVWEQTIAPAGLDRVSGDAFAEWSGDLLVAGLISKDVRRLQIEGGSVADETSLFAELGRRIRDVREAPDGAIYILTDHTDGAIMRIEPE